MTLVSHEGATEEAWQFVDVISLNRYYGWYTQSGRIEVGVERLSREIDLVHERFPGPFILSEFGTDTIPGHHAEPPEMFSEEYQAEFLSQYIAMLNSKPFVVGQHIWNLCDFKTSTGCSSRRGHTITKEYSPVTAAPSWQRTRARIWTK